LVSKVETQLVGYNYFAHIPKHHIEFNRLIDFGIQGQQAFEEHQNIMDIGVTMQKNFL
jgi:hypothetical protein